jgi:hypothetical protein
MLGPEPDQSEIVLFSRIMALKTIPFAVLSLVELGGNIRSFVTSDVTADDVGQILLENIGRDSHLMTGSAAIYMRGQVHKAICETRIHRSLERPVRKAAQALKRRPPSSAIPLDPAWFRLIPPKLRKVYTPRTLVLAELRHCESRHPRCRARGLAKERHALVSP